MSFSITTWNINSVRIRLDGLAALIEEENPDLICLQETKVPDHLFPANEIADLGYPYQAVSGMKSYNGVAILSKFPLIDPQPLHWCGREDCRHLFAGVIVGGAIGTLEIHSLYVPAGGNVPDPLENPKFAHKLEFLGAQTHWWTARGTTPHARILVGDLNIAPLASDVWSHQRLKNVITHTDIEIRALSQLQQAGRWVDAVRHQIPEDAQAFTWWSYRATDWEVVNKGRRLDHIWISEDLTGRTETISILKQARDWTRPSDHVPVTLRLTP